MDRVSVPIGRLLRLSGIFLLLGGLALAVMNTDAARAGGKIESQVKLAATPGTIDNDGRQTIIIKMKINEGWHAYANSVKNEGLEPDHTVVKIESAKKLDEVVIVYPPGKRHTFDGENFQIYEGSVEIKASFKRALGDASPLDVSVQFSTCNDEKGICLKRETVKLAVK